MDEGSPDAERARELELQIKYRLVEQLAASEQKYRELIESIREMAFKCDEALRLTFANRAWTETLGRAPADVVGKPLLDFIAPEDQPLALEALRAASPGRLPELRVLAADGSMLWCELATRQVPGEGRVGSLYNIDARKRAKDELTRLNDELQRTNAALEIALEDATEAERLKSEFLSTISHELRTPLNAVANLPSLLASDIQDRPVLRCSSCKTEFAPEDEDASVRGESVPCPECKKPLTAGSRTMFVGDPKEHRHFLNTMHLSARHLLNLVNDVLDFSRLDANRMPFVFSEVTLSEVLSDVETTMAVLAQEKELVMSYEMQTGMPEQARADPVKLTQILVNLIGNAIKFTPRGGRIAVRFSQAEESGIPHLRCEVEDTGEGIPADKLDAVFESFRQLDSGATRRHGGTGLGLAITKKLVEGHGGQIGATSELGRGSVFWFTMPFAPFTGAVAESREARHGTAGGARPKVLVIDDRLEELEVAKRALEQDGSFEAVLLERPEVALEMIKLHKPACIVLDVLMPIENGLTILRRLKQDGETRDIPTLVTTAYRVNERVVQALGAHWFPKPWDSAQLLAKVWSVIQARQASTS